MDELPPMDADELAGFWTRSLREPETTWSREHYVRLHATLTALHTERDALAARVATLEWENAKLQRDLDRAATSVNACARIITEAAYEVKGIVAPLVGDDIRLIDPDDFESAASDA